MRLDSTESGLEREDSHHFLSFSDCLPITAVRKSSSNDEEAMRGRREVVEGRCLRAFRGRRRRSGRRHKDGGSVSSQSLVAVNQFDKKF